MGFSDAAPRPYFRPPGNIAPFRHVLVGIRDPDTGARIPTFIRWGMIPSWDEKRKFLLSNVTNPRETVSTAPATRDA